MGFYWLRVCVWLVGIAALLANVVVMLVVFRKKFNYSVPRFLMSNLAFADFCTAIYLLLLAYEDLVSSEKYFNYAYTWQNGNYRVSNACYLTANSGTVRIIFTSCGESEYSYRLIDIVNFLYDIIIILYMYIYIYIY
jgi:hypothetical protein